MKYHIEKKQPRYEKRCVVVGVPGGFSFSNPAVVLELLKQWKRLLHLGAGIRRQRYKNLGYGGGHAPNDYSLGK